MGVSFFFVRLLNDNKKRQWVAEHNNRNKIQCHYICSLRAVEFLITIVIKFFQVLSGEWYFKACIIWQHFPYRETIGLEINTKQNKANNRRR